LGTSYGGQARSSLKLRRAGPREIVENNSTSHGAGRGDSGFFLLIGFWIGDIIFVGLDSGWENSFVISMS